MAIINDFRIASIVPRGDPAPIEVRVIRKWKRSNDLFYLMIDKYGDAIQATVPWLDNDYFERKISLFSCYLLDDYICNDAPTSLKVNAHPASILMGTTTTITLIPSSETFPMHYFNFCPYANLHLRIDDNLTDEKPSVLTDYMGKIEDTVPGITKKGKNYLRVKLTDISGPNIDVTLWEEVLPRFDKQAMLSAEEPIVVAFTSLKVTIFKGHTSDKLQLSSTPATHIYFNPDVESAIEARNRFKEKTLHLLAATPGYESQERHLRAEDRNKRTISELLEHQKENQGQTFSCQASVTSYIKGRPWYYTMCPQCPRKIYQTKRGWSCGSHQNLPEPKFMYCVAATISDNTAPTMATFFDEATVGLIGIQCKDMVLKHGYTDRYQTPEPLYEAIGKDVTMQVQYAHSTTPNPNSSVLSVNKVYDSKLNITATPPSPTQQTTPTADKKLALESNENKPSAKRQLYQSGVSDTKKLRFSE
ncbi:uncharacterized protein LOC110879412 isoform X2 [Helianthus annuus]|uniref:uncharacterized protein LOC110879412 isoform X2 n=1 Tax=Helianthus annuus TaxID=4232 RepID=UPI0016531693|nr:uncharacterized protein LOC110879412 isoform X2 [Helianthus annuus]